MQTLARSVLAVTVLALAGCMPQTWQDKPAAAPAAPVAQGPQTEREVEGALQRYSGLIVTMDAAAIADMYAPDGVWERQSGALRGRDAIRNALASPAGVRVVSNQMTTAYLSYNGPAVIQTGEFKQSARLADGKVVNATGRFEATWMRGPNGQWMIHRMVTRPAK